MLFFPPPAPPPTKEIHTENKYAEGPSREGCLQGVAEKKQTEDGRGRLYARGESVITQRVNSVAKKSYSL